MTMTTRKAATKAAKTTEPAKSSNGIDEMNVGELQAKFAEVVGEKTRSPNKAYLLRRIREVLAAAAARATEPEGGAGTEVAREAAQPAALADTAGVDTDREAPASPATAAEIAEPASTPKLSKLDLPALQALYREVIGRETRSTSRHYG